MTMELKVCNQEDVDALRHISRETFTDTFGAQNSLENLAAYLDQAYAPEQLRRELANKNSKFYFLYSDGELAGYMKLNIHDAQTEEMGADALEVERIYIRTRFKRRRLGKQLIEKAMEVARELDRKTIWLGVWEENQNAIAFYKKMGFVHVGSHSFYMGDDEQTDYIMQKALD